MKKVLVLIKYYKPAYKTGGPVKSVSNIIRSLKTEKRSGTEFYVICRDRDSGDPLPFPNIEDGWNRLDHEMVKYRAPEKWNIFLFLREFVFGGYQRIYLNSFFSLEFSIIPVIIANLTFRSSKLIIAPRGEFNDGALNQKNRLKLSILNFVRIIGLYNKISWHSTNDVETEKIREFFSPKAKVRCISNLAEIDSVVKSLEPPNETLKIIYLSRINRIKNLDYVLKVLSQVDKECSFHLHIYGSAGTEDEQNYLELCKRLVVDLGLANSVTYHGQVEPKNVKQILRKHHLFMLPTQGENFGHAIMEALSARLPVLISNNTPWKNLEQMGIGWDIPLTEVDSYVDVIERCTRMGKTDWTKIQDALSKFIIDYSESNSRKELEYEKLFSIE